MPITIRNCTGLQLRYTGGIFNFDLMVGQMSFTHNSWNQYLLGSGMLAPGHEGTWSPRLPGQGKNLVVYTNSYHEPGAARVKVATTNAILYVVALEGAGTKNIIDQPTSMATDLSPELNPNASMWKTTAAGGRVDDVIYRFELPVDRRQVPPGANASVKFTLQDTWMQSVSYSSSITSSLEAALRFSVPGLGVLPAPVLSAKVANAIGSVRSSGATQSSMMSQEFSFDVPAGVYMKIVLRLRMGPGGFRVEGTREEHGAMISANRGVCWAPEIGPFIAVRSIREVLFLAGT